MRLQVKYTVGTFLLVKGNNIVARYPLALRPLLTRIILTSDFCFLYYVYHYSKPF
jgi:hypothetical protein